MNQHLTTALADSINDIRAALSRGDYGSEAAISDGVVRRLIADLGWPPYDTRVVFPQFPIENRKVDFALCHPRDKPIVLLEVKNVGRADERGERQLFEYCFHQGVPIAVLTDGRIWKLFYPAGEGRYTDRLFHEADLVNGNTAEIADGLIRYLAYRAVKSGDASRRASEDCKAMRLQRRAAAKFSSVWNKLLLGPDPKLVELFEEEVETASGVRPARQSVVAFIKEQGTERIASSPVTRPQSRLLKPAQSDPDGAKNDPSHFYEIDGKMVICRTAKEVLVKVFEEFAKRDPTFCERFAKRVSGRTRTYVARSRKDLNDPVELPGGWWIGTHSPNSQKRKWIKVACELAGYGSGRNFGFRIP